MLASLAVIVVTAALVWFLAPRTGDVGRRRRTTDHDAGHATHRGRRHADDRPRPSRPTTAPATVDALTGTSDRAGRASKPGAGSPSTVPAAALDALDAGQIVLVAAPTGSGKTLVAEYAIARPRADGGKAFYTTPLKALSNQKYGDLVREHGREHGRAAHRRQLGQRRRTGRGDDHRGAAQHDLRGVADARRPALRRARRGALPPGPLPRPGVGGGDRPPAARGRRSCASRRRCRTRRRSRSGSRRCAAAPPRSSRSTGRSRSSTATWSGSGAPTRCTCCPRSSAAPDGELRPNPEAARLDARNARDPGRRWPAAAAGCRTPEPGRDRRAARRRADAARDRVRVQPRRLRPGGRAVPRRRVCASPSRASGARSARIAERQHRGPRRRRPRRARATTSGWPGSRPGFAAHHAGMVPPMKEAVEEAFAAGLVKVVFATETLALGINMPARSVVIEKLSKFTGERHEFLTPGEYTQLTGRAGRRGIDELGYAVVCWSPFVPFDQVASLASRRTDALASSFRPTYNMAANLVRRVHEVEAHHLLNLSFAQFHADRDVVALERQLERTPRPGRARQRAPVGRRPRRRRGVPGARSAELDALRREPRRAAADRRGARGPAAGRRRRRCGAGAGGSWSSTTSTGGAGAPGCSRSRPVATSCGSGPRTSTTPPRRVAHHRAPAPVRAPQPGASGGRRPSGCGGSSSATTAVGHAATERRARRARDARSPSTRSPSDPAARPRSCGPPPRSSASNATCSASSAGCAGRSESLARQFDRVLARARGVGLRRRLVAHRRGRAAGPPLHRDRPAARRVDPRGAARRAPPGRARRGRVVLHLRAARPRRRSSRCRRRAGRPRRSRSARARDRAHRRRPPCQRGRRRAARDPPARPGLHPLHRTTGPAATPSPTCSTTTR